MPWLGYACGTCEYCLTGWETLCPKQQNTGYSVDGGFAEYFLAEAAFAAPVPDGRSARGGPAHLRRGDHLQGGQGRRTCARPTWLRSPGSAASGHLALQYAKIVGGTVAAVDITDEKLKLANELGADIVIDARTEDPGEVLQAHGGADVAVGLAVDDSRSPPPTRGCAAAAGWCWSRCPRPGRCDPGLRHRAQRDLGDRVDRRHPRRPGHVFALHAAGRTRGGYATRPLAYVNEAIDEVLHGKAKARSSFSRRQQQPWPRTELLRP